MVSAIELCVQNNRIGFSVAASKFIIEQIGAVGPSKHEGKGSEDPHRKKD